VKPCLAQALTWMSSILGLQLAVDKVFIYYLVINLTSWSASSAAFTVSAGVRMAAVGNLLIAVIFVVSMVRKWKSLSFCHTHTHAHTHTHTQHTTHTLHTHTHTHTHAECCQCMYLKLELYVLAKISTGLGKLIDVPRNFNFNFR